MRFHSGSSKIALKRSYLSESRIYYIQDVFIVQNVFNVVLFSVSQTICDPVHVTYFIGSVNPDSGTLYSLNVLDIGPLNSTDVFNVPKQCL